MEGCWGFEATVHDQICALEGPHCPEGSVSREAGGDARRVGSGLGEGSPGLDQVSVIREGERRF